MATAGAVACFLCVCVVGGAVLTGWLCTYSVIKKTIIIYQAQCRLLYLVKDSKANRTAAEYPHATVGTAHKPTICTCTCRGDEQRGWLEDSMFVFEFSPLDQKHGQVVSAAACTHTAAVAAVTTFGPHNIPLLADATSSAAPKPPHAVFGAVSHCKLTLLAIKLTSATNAVADVVVGSMRGYYRGRLCFHVLMGE